MKLTFTFQMLRKVFLFSYVYFLVNGARLSRRDLRGLLSTTEGPFDDLRESSEALIKTFDFQNTVSPDQEYEIEEATELKIFSDKSDTGKESASAYVYDPPKERFSHVRLRDDVSENDSTTESLNHASLVIPPNVLVEPQLELCLHRLDTYGKLPYIK